MAASCQCQDSCVHIAGVDNRLPDILSGWSKVNNPQLFRERTTSDWREVAVPKTL